MLQDHKERVIKLAKKKHNQQQEKSTLSLSDTLNEDILSKLKATKEELRKIEHQKEEQRKEQKRRERKEREKNKTFEELLEEYGDIGSKY